MKKLGLLLMGLLLGAALAQAQTLRVSGTVTGAEDGMPIPGVSVIVKGTTIGTATDMDGKYTLNVPSDAQTLVFSYIGYATQEVALAGRTNGASIDVAMASASEDIEEVVVTALGISREKKALGYAAQTFGGEDIASATISNPMSALQGRVAGVEITTPAGPGATQNVIIRGASSFSSNQPLYIVDGVPLVNAQISAGSGLNSTVDFGSGINALNPDDIETMTTLVGAAATALYGSRAANGVVMITTKKGKDTAGKIKVNYDGSFTLSRVGRLPLEQTEFGQGWSGARALNENGNWGPRYDGKNRVWGNVIDNTQRVKPYVYLNNRVRDFYDTGINYKNALSMMGGSENTSYYLSVSQNHQDGVIPTDNDSYKRYTVSTRGSHKGKYLQLSSSINFSSEKYKSVSGGQGESLHRSLYEIANDISIVDLKDYLKDPHNTLDGYFTPYGLNPYFVVNENGNYHNKNKFFGYAQVDITPIEHLKLTYRFGGDFEASDINRHWTIVAFDSESPNAGSSAVNPGRYLNQLRQRAEVNHDFMANYDWAITDKLGLNVLAGLNINDRQYGSVQGEIKSIDVPGTYRLFNTLETAKGTQDGWRRRMMGVYANLDFNWDSYLFLSLAARNDWSSTLPLANNSFFYPSATLSFLITDFLDKQGVSVGPIDFAKVRVAVGQTGNDAPTYRIYDTFSSSGSFNPGYSNVNNLLFPLQGVNAYTMGDTKGNEALKPEITTEFEVGAEIKMFQNRVGLDVSYYNRITRGLIEFIPLDPMSGYVWQIDNLGDVRNKGIEFTLGLTPVRSDIFTWDISYNFSKNMNMVEKLNGVDEVNLEGFGGCSIYAVEGKPMGQFKTSIAKTVEIDGKTYTVVDGDGYPMPSAEVKFTGQDINEKFRMGLTNTFNFFGISLGATLDFRYGGYMYSDTKRYMYWTGSGPESVYNGREPFIVPNSVYEDKNGNYVENTTPVKITALNEFYNDGGFKRSDWFILDRSYLKLRNVNISYSLPKSICEKLRMDGITVSFNANNFLLWTPAENCYIDPEVTTFGNDISGKFGEFHSNPSEHFYTFGLNLKF